MTDAPGSRVTVRARFVPLTVKPSPLNRGKIVVSPYRMATTPASSVPSADGVVAIGEVAVTVVVAGELPVLVSVRSVIATLLSVMNFFSATLRSDRVKAAEK